MINRRKSKNDHSKGHPVDIPQAIDYTWGVKIPMRDGVLLNATLYKPKDPPPTPAIFTLTPYIADMAHKRGVFFAENGYAFAAVDSRGRGNSQGTFEPFANEAQDGHDIVEWLAQQSWCDGQVAMWGGSYGGYDQWLTLREAPPHLKTIVPAAAAHAGVDFPIFKNIFSTFEMQWMTYVSGAAHNMAIMDDPAFWNRKFLEMYLQHRPYAELDEIVGNTSTYFQTWIRHPRPDEYWDRMAISAEQYDRIDLPIMTITGHYDDDQPGAMEYYRRHMASHSLSRQAHYIMIGPWDHAGTRDPKRDFGGLHFAPNAVLDLNQLHKEWYDWTMKGAKKPAFLKKRVAYYVMAAEKWKYADSLEAIGATAKKYFLRSDGNANDVFHSGILGPRAVRSEPPDHFIYDPLDTRPGELEVKASSEYLADQTFDLNLFGNGLVYHTEAFERSFEVTGWVKLNAWISMDVPDTDFRATVSEILPDGRLVRLSQDLLRARYRESLRAEKLVLPGEINLYLFDGFTFFSRRISQGSRLRLTIACCNTIFLEKNYNAGGVVARESGKQARIAHVTLYHDKDHPSYLEVPMVR